MNHVDPVPLIYTFPAACIAGPRTWSKRDETHRLDETREG
jgi:hypothetical protein